MSKINIKPFLKIVLLSLIASCQYSEETTNNYMGYYDAEHTQLKMKGVLVNDREDGTWEYYSQDGALVQKGIYKDGYQKGDWEYHFNTFDTTVSWEINQFQEFKFSLPVSFRESQLDNDNLTFTALDSLNGDVFSIRSYPIKNTNEIGNFFEQTKAQMGIDFDIVNSKSSIINQDSVQYYLDEFSLVHKATKNELVMYQIYTIVNNQLVVLVYSCKPQSAIRAKFFNGEIFYHTTYNDTRIADPFTSIKEVDDRN